MSATRKKGRCEWANGKFELVEMQVPGDFTPHGWGPAYVPGSDDTLKEVLTHLDEMVEDGVLTSEERARSRFAPLPRASSPCAFTLAFCLTRHNRHAHIGV